MNRFMTAGVYALLLCGFAIPAGAKDEPSGSWDGLVEVKPKRVDAAYLMPGADFRPYKKLMIDPAEIAFRKDWMKKMNDPASMSRRVTQEDAEEIAAAAREGFAEVFNEAFKAKGLEIVTAPGPDVLRLRPGVIDLYITAPDTGMTMGRSRTYTVESGEATLFLEALDSTTGALLGRALDRRATRNSGRASISNSVTNRADFRALFKQWAEICVKGFEDLHAMSPVPEDLKPGQKLQP